ncbi:TWiK family of potassium channels protein 18-like [Saccoglossus kowalevskii]|uniref:TWiK family of potassium channels protein 18-like n=1 Tax=Saccoglossus kowalevskii TaxID=10224 RepID=A0ABM0MRH4_SACKO|nr:PREDICTED: TWiK family of potassium channels protein 18-like [Saccoglossus kowalevskii]
MADTKETRLRSFWLRYGLLLRNFGFVGVLALYLIFGGVMFLYIEGSRDEQRENDICHMMTKLVMKTEVNISNMLTSDIVNVTENVQNVNFTEMLTDTFSNLGTELCELHDAEHPNTMLPWRMSSAVFFCFTVVTTIGYGNIVPVTRVGRVLTIVYAIAGIPLLLLVLSVIGQNLAKRFKMFCVKLMCQKVKVGARLESPVSTISTPSNTLVTVRRNNDTTKDTFYAAFGGALCRHEATQTDELTDCDKKENSAGNTSTSPECVMLITLCVIIYITLGALIQVYIEEWSFLDGFYFIFVSLSTIGFGDVMPEVTNDKSRQAIGPFLCVYILFGMSLLSTMFTLVQDRVLEIFYRIKNKLCDTDD